MIKFPVITHIDQVREAIKDRPEFIEADKGDYIVFNYMVAHSDSFDCPVRRECRGLIFGKDGKVLSRRFHKFFNMGEKEETMPHNVDLSKPHVILDKLDGSMITPLVFSRVDEEDGDYFDVRWATKMGITDIGLMVENYLNRDIKLYTNYIRFVLYCMDQNDTPIFEYTGPYNRIVLDHQEESLVLLAVRNNETGDYICYDGLKDLSDFYGIPLVQPYQGTIDDLARATDIEGVVIRFDDGHMVKVKTDWYVAIHKAKENILFEKNVLRLILEEKLDDVLPHLLENDMYRLSDYQMGINFAINSVMGCMQITQRMVQKKLKTRKEFALENIQTLHPFEKKMAFMVWDKPDMTEEEMRARIIEQLLKLCGSQVDIDKHRDILKVKWNPTGEIEDVSGTISI